LEHGVGHVDAGEVARGGKRPDQLPVTDHAVREANVQDARAGRVGEPRQEELDDALRQPQTAGMRKVDRRREVLPARLEGAMVFAGDTSLQIFTDEASDEGGDSGDGFDKAHVRVSIPLENAGAARRSGARTRTVELSTEWERC